MWNVLWKNKLAEFVLKIKGAWMTFYPLGNLSWLWTHHGHFLSHPLLSCFLPTTTGVLLGLAQRTCKCLGWIRMLFLCKNTRHFRNRKSLSGPTIPALFRFILISPSCIFTFLRLLIQKKKKGISCTCLFTITGPDNIRHTFYFGTTVFWLIISKISLQSK